MSITFCATDCWPSSETKVTSSNSWAFPTLPSIYVHMCNTYLFKECSLPLPRINWPFHIDFSVPKSNFRFQSRNETSPRKLCKFYNLTDLVILADLENLAMLVNQVILVNLVNLVNLVILVKMVILVNIYCQQLGNIRQLN